MNTLLPYEHNWITNRLKIYRIKYAEIYNEVFDHILSACEDKRRHGDTRPILSLFQETMDQDIGSHQGIVQMTEDREYTLKKTLKVSLTTEFKSYFSSTKLLTPFGVACVVYFSAQLLQLNPNWLVIFSILLSWVPYFYLLVIGTKNGYLRTITSKRKTSLVNRLMFGISNTMFVGFYAGLFCMPSLTALFPIGLSGSNTVKSLIHFLGHPGFALIIAVQEAYTLSFIKIANTDYRRLIQQLG